MARSTLRAALTKCARASIQCRRLAGRRGRSHVQHVKGLAHRQGRRSADLDAAALVRTRVEHMKRQVGADARPGIVVSIASAGNLLQWHPHGHLLVTDGAFSDDGAFHPLETWDGDAVMKLFRERLLARLTEQHAISEALARKLLAWRHPGFGARRSCDPVRG